MLTGANDLTQNTLGWMLDDVVAAVCFTHVSMMELTRWHHVPPRS